VLAACAHREFFLTDYDHQELFRLKKEARQKSKYPLTGVHK
jgi:hypothetical protein